MYFSTRCVEFLKSRAINLVSRVFLWKIKTYFQICIGFVWKSQGKPGEVSTLSTKFSTEGQGKVGRKMTEKGERVGEKEKKIYEKYYSGAASDLGSVLARRAA